MNMPCPFTSTQHTRIYPEMLGWCQRNINDKAAADKLFMYRHNLYGTFVLAQWLKDGVFVDVLNLGHSLANFTRQKARHLIRMFNQDATSEFKRHMAETDYAFKRSQTDQASAYHDRFTRQRSTKTQVGYSHV